MDHQVRIWVNNNQVDVVGPHETGLSIKQAAIEQRVDIELDFVLSQEIGERKTKIIGDDDPVEVHPGTKFVAVPPDDNSGPIKLEVSEALEELRHNFSEHPMTFSEDGQGGVKVILEGLSLEGSPFTEDETWVGFALAPQYPYADVYPHFVRGDLRRKDGQAVAVPVTRNANTSFEGRAAYQVSRRSKRWDASRDTAALKLHKVLSWLRDLK